MSRLLWTQRQDLGPAARYGCGMAFDPVRGRTVLFGGTSTAGISYPDTWAWDGGSWTQLDDSGPVGRFSFGMTGDTTRKCVVLFGGETAAGKLMGDTWEWDGTA